MEHDLQEQSGAVIWNPDRSTPPESCCSTRNFAKTSRTRCCCGTTRAFVRFDVSGSEYRIRRCSLSRAFSGARILSKSAQHLNSQLMAPSSDTSTEPREGVTVNSWPRCRKRTPPLNLSAKESSRPQNYLPSSKLTASSAVGNVSTPV